MITMGRLLSVVGCAGIVFLLSLSIAPIRASLSTSESGVLLMNVMGALTALGAFTAWPLALYHWGTRFSGSDSARRRWGFYLTLGAFIGGWCYWLLRKQGGHVQARGPARPSVN